MDGDSQQPSEDSPEAIAARHRQTWFLLGGVVGGVLLLLFLYHWFTQPPPEPGTGATLSSRQIADVARPLVGNLRSFAIGGQPQPAGMAVTLAEGEMVTTCHSLPRAGPLEVAFHDGTSKAESARLNRELDVCLLRVKTTGRTSAKLRSGDTRKTALTAKAFDTDRSFMMVEVADNELHYECISRRGVTVDRGVIIKGK